MFIVLLMIPAVLGAIALFATWYAIVSPDDEKAAVKVVEDLENPKLSQQDSPPPTASLYVGYMLEDVKCVYGSIDTAGAVSARVAIADEPFIITIKFGKQLETVPHAVAITPSGNFPSTTPLCVDSLHVDGFKVCGTGSRATGMGLPLFYYMVAV
jgi:hypothetical protein